MHMTNEWMLLKVSLHVTIFICEYKGIKVTFKLINGCRLF